MERASEDGLIARYFAPLAGPGAFGLRDDAAILTPTPGHDLVLTADAIVAGVHYFPDDPPAAIARKALAVNVSDLAAKGAEPRGFLLTLALPDDWTEAWLADFSAALGRAAAACRCPLLGGDTVRAGGEMLVGVSALGEVPSGAMVRRTTARVGDRICVSGTIGDAALGLALRLEPDAPWAATLDASMRAHLADRYLHPRPRLALAPVLRRHASAAMDVSDGLAGDLAKMLVAEMLVAEMLAAEGQGASDGRRSARITASAVPLSPAAAAALAADPALIDPILTGGDDYEILCTVDPGALAALLADAEAAGVTLTPIGTVVSADGPPAFEMGDGGARLFADGAFRHF